MFCEHGLKTIKYRNWYQTQQLCICQSLYITLGILNNVRRDEQEQRHVVVSTKTNKQKTVLPELLSSLDVFTGKEGNVWETKVLVRCEHSTGKQVGLAHVIEEAADVSIETGIDAVQVLWLWGKINEKAQAKKKAVK